MSLTSPHAILDDWRTYLCEVSSAAFAGLCRHDLSNKMVVQTAKEREERDYRRCLAEGQKTVDAGNRSLFSALLDVTTTYPHGGDPSSYLDSRTKAEEHALAATGFYFRRMNGKIPVSHGM